MVSVVWLRAQQKPWFKVSWAGVNSTCGVAVGPIQTMVPRLFGQVCHRNCGVAAGPIETMVRRFAGHGVSGNCAVAAGARKEPW